MSAQPRANQLGVARQRVNRQQLGAGPLVWTSALGGENPGGLAPLLETLAVGLTTFLALTLLPLALFAAADPGPVSDRLLRSSLGVLALLVAVLSYRTWHRKRAPRSLTLHLRNKEYARTRGS